MKYPTTSPTLLDKIAGGDEIGWDEFYERYKPVVLALAKFKGLDDAAAKDVLQQVMLAFFQQSRTFRFDPDIARFRTYFGRIVTARIADYYRNRAKDPSVWFPDNAEPFTEPPEFDACFLAEFRKTVWVNIYQQVKQRVSASTWQAFDLYALQHRPVKKVAEFLGCSVNQVYQAKKRLIAIIREILDELNRRDPELMLELIDND